MERTWHFLKEEFLDLLPPTIFFFVAIGLLMFTKRLMLQQYGINSQISPLSSLAPSSWAKLY